MDKITVGIIGPGYWASAFHIPGLKARREVDIVALCGRDRERIRPVAEMFSIRTIFTSVTDLIDSGLCQAAVICTPNHLHAPIGIQALERGLSILIEKPMAVSAEEATSFYRAIKVGTGVAHVNFSRRYWNSMRLLHDEVVKRNLQGAIREVRIVDKTSRAAWAYLKRPAPEVIRMLLRTRQDDLPNFRSWDESMGGGVIHDIGSHLIDQVLWITNAGVRSVRCMPQHSRGAPDTKAAIELALGQKAHATIDIDAAWPDEPSVTCEVAAPGFHALAIGAEELYVNGGRREPDAGVVGGRSAIDEFIEAMGSRERDLNATVLSGYRVACIVWACHEARRGMIQVEVEDPAM